MKYKKKQKNNSTTAHFTVYGLVDQNPEVLACYK